MSYFLPEPHAYGDDSPFWEVVYCLDELKEEDSFRLVSSDFRFDRGRVLDPATFSKYLADAIENKALSRIGGGRGFRFRLNETVPQDECIPKPLDFVMNEWLAVLMAGGRIGKGALWLLNYLAFTRWKKLGGASIEDLGESLRNLPFSFDLKSLKGELDKARNTRTESPKEPLQLLWKLGIVLPTIPNSFSSPRRDQQWKFVIDPKVFEREPLERRPESSVFRTLEIVRSLLAKEMRRLEGMGLDSEKQAIGLGSDRVYTTVRRRVSEQGLRMPPGIQLKASVRRFLRGLDGKGVIDLGETGQITVTSGSIGSKDEMYEVAKEVMADPLRRAERLRVRRMMEPFALHRDQALVDLVLSVGRKLQLSPKVHRDFFLYLEARSGRIPATAYSDFAEYCEKHFVLLWCGIGFNEILSGFAELRGLPANASRGAAKKQFRFRMKGNEYSTELPDTRLPMPVSALGWARLRRTLSMIPAPGPSRQVPDGTTLKVELRDAAGSLVFRETTTLLHLAKEELPPTGDLSGKFRDAKLPLKLIVSSSRAVPNLHVVIGLEMGSESSLRNSPVQSG